MATLLLAFLLSPGAPVDADAVRRLIAASGAEVAVAYRSLDGRDELFVNADTAFHAASTMKVPVMIELFRQAHEGALGLQDPLPIKNTFRSIVDGSEYELSVGEDSDREVHGAIGKTMTLRELCEAMIVVSSNLAANLLIEKVGVQHIRRTMTALGADGVQVLRGVEDDKAFRKGLSNTTTARGLLVLLEKLAKGQAVNPEADAAMVAILKGQKFNDGIPAGLPAGTPVAHKTGSITRIHHDAAIVYANRPYVLVLLVRGIEDRKTSAALMASLSKAIYESPKR